jgi:hypothetical protein
MKRYFLIAFLLFISVNLASSQTQVAWDQPGIPVTISANGQVLGKLEIDRGFKFAHLSLGENRYKLIFPSRNPNRTRIVDVATNQTVAEGRGVPFRNSGSLTFSDGEVYHLFVKRKRDGYDIIGPYGIIFSVTDGEIMPVKVLSDKEIMVQALYVFDRINTTQQVQPQVIYQPIVTSTATH